MSSSPDADDLPGAERFPGTESFEGEPKVWAGGGVVIRDGRVLLVHRPRYDDWTFPKGKLDPGETLAECAVREVHEETGLRCELGKPLVATRYVDGKGRLKEVRYWLMAVIDGEFAVNDEVDDVRWLSAEDAAGQLSYSRDAPVAEAAQQLLAN